MIKIGLLGHCQYTRVALTQMLEKIYKQNGGVTLFPLNEINLDTQRNAVQLDYLIISGYQDMSFCYSLTTLLKEFYHHPQRLIVMAEQRPPPLINHFFAQYCAHYHFIPLGKKCIDIKRGLQIALFSKYAPRVKATSIGSLLTTREYQVVKALYSGMRVAELCAELSRSKKTISGHKLHALDKLQYLRADVFHHALMMAALQVSM